MRFLTIGIGLLLFTPSAYAQSPCNSQTLAYDPYKPSDLAIVRDYGGTVLAQAPLSTLLKLDPYVPSQGELLRQVGRGIPIWTTYAWHPYPAMPTVPDCGREPAPEPSPAAAPLTTFAEMLGVLERARATTATSSSPVVRATPPRRNTGVSIMYDGRAWVSAGAAVPFRQLDFVRVGESAGFSIFRHAGTKDDLIFVPTTQGLVAPFRANR